MDEGYILSNKFRRAIFDGFIQGQRNIKNIAKKHRIIPSVAIRIADDLVKGGLLKKNGNIYTLTEEGEKLAQSIKG